MSLNKVKPGSNMYQFASMTWNPIRGFCINNCKYCYMKRFPLGDLRLDEKTLRDNLRSGQTIFVGSSTDMFAADVPLEWIERVLERCCQFDNTYLFQTKNPQRFLSTAGFPEKTILGTTLESNRDYPEVSQAPAPVDRYLAFSHSPQREKMVSIEPIMDFDLGILLRWMEAIKPKFVSIGADSKGHRLCEPSPGKIIHLISGLSEFTDVKVKRNLDRIIKVKE